MDAICSDSSNISKPENFIYLKVDQPKKHFLGDPTSQIILLILDFKKILFFYK